MRDAVANGMKVLASAKAPVLARCPACGGEVELRRRRNGKETVWFYRHKRGAGYPDCPRRTQNLSFGN